ncbi:TFIIB-type zinc ribbon-containing protein [Allokutzneria oryzae]|uniref:Zf-TFIIB domain-containing protein n=1 Tax=Allokutzneria oryzae TaxID=1378989 RepID=A0ABV5ZW81_9PSEU
MISYERNGVHVDQCRGCKGLYLDFGELEQLVAASSRHYERKRREADESRPETEEERKKRKKDEEDDFIEGILDFII